MVGDKTKQKNSGELETSLAPAEAEVGAVAKADQKMLILMMMLTREYFEQNNGMEK